MKDRNSPIEEIDSTITTLAAGSVEKIDFDRIVELLRDSRETLDEREVIRSELSEIKADYRARIIGLLKANLACRENDEERELAIRLTDDTIEMSAGELMLHYRRISSRFRKNFPATFRNLSFVNNDRAGHRDWRDYKI